jgi:hypothetical protein
MRDRRSLPSTHLQLGYRVLCAQQQRVSMHERRDARSVVTRGRGGGSGCVAGWGKRTVCAGIVAQSRSMPLWRGGSARRGQDIIEPLIHVVHAHAQVKVFTFQFASRRGGHVEIGRYVGASVRRYLVDVTSQRRLWLRMRATQRIMVKNSGPESALYCISAGCLRDRVLAHSWGDLSTSLSARRCSGVCCVRPLQRVCREPRRNLKGH